MSKRSKVDKSHFVPNQLINHFRGSKPGPKYSDETWKEVRTILDSDYNTSEATSSWNRGVNKRHENEIVKYARSEIEYDDMSAGAQRRYDEMGEAWEDIREDIHEIAPGLAAQGDLFFDVDDDD